MRGTIHVDTEEQRRDTFLRRGRYRWPYIKYSTYLAQPDTLASAGFSFQPAKDAPDNTQCFDCGFELVGWEATDDPFAEHIAHRPDCTYAQLHCPPRVSLADGKIDWIGWPLDRDEKLTKKASQMEWAKMHKLKADVAMRKATFTRGVWPHQGKKAWTLTPQQLAEAGFYFTPVKAGDDTASCVFCGYALGDWEPDDDPVAEHRKRAADCLFFRLEAEPEADVAMQEEEMPQAEDEVVVKLEPGVRNTNKRSSEAVVVSDSEAEHSDAASVDSKRPRVEKPAEQAGVAHDGSSEGEGNDESEDIAEAEDIAKTEDIAEVQDIAEVEDIAEVQDIAEAKDMDDINEQDNPDTVSELDYYNRQSDQEQHAQFGEPILMGSAENTQATAVGDDAPQYSARTGTVADHELLGDTQQSTQTDEQQYAASDPELPEADMEKAADDGEWELSESEESLTVEEFIRKCCRQRVSALEASAAQMVSAFMQKAEDTREHISSMTW